MNTCLFPGCHRGEHHEFLTHRDANGERLDDEAFALGMAVQEADAWLAEKVRELLAMEPRP